MSGSVSNKENFPYLRCKDQFLSSGVDNHLFRIFGVDAAEGDPGNVKTERKDAFNVVE